jgi:hypothetical protein
LTSAVDVNDEEPVDTPVDPSNGPWNIERCGLNGIHELELEEDVDKGPVSHLIPLV